MYKLFKIKLFVFCISFFAYTSYAGDSTGYAVKNLKNWDCNKKEIIPLNCNWEFYWNKLLFPGDFKSSMNKPDTLLNPGSWGDVKINGKFIGSHGYATYRLKLVNLPKHDLLLDAYSIQTSYRIFVNGKLSGGVGTPGKNKVETRPGNRDIQVRIPSNVSTVEIIVQVANFHHRKGGFVHAFELGTVNAINNQRLMFYGLDFIESSALAIIGLFLFALFIFRRKDYSILYFSLFCLTLCFRPVISVNYLLATIFPDMSWQLLVKMEYFAVLFPCLFMCLFMKELFPAQLPIKMVKALIAVFSVKILVVLFFEPVVFSWLILPLLFLIPFGVLIFAIAIIRAIFAKVEGAKFAALGIIILLGSQMLKVFVYSGIAPPVYVLITTFDIGFIFMMSLILGSRFSLQFVRVEALQKKTKQQAYEIEREKELVEEKNKEIVDSIHYAKRIQQALLPSEKYIEKSLNRDNKKK